MWVFFTVYDTIKGIFIKNSYEKKSEFNWVKCRVKLAKETWCNSVNIDKV